MIIVIALFLYEIFFNPIRAEYARGLERIQGNFGDVASYGIYLNMFLIVMFFMSMIKEHKLIKRKNIQLLITILICLVAQSRLNHVATFVVFVAEIVIASVFIFRRNLKNLIYIAFILMFFGIGIYQYIKGNENINVFLNTEMGYLGDESDIDKFGHGRMGRFKYIFNEIYPDVSMVGKMFGTPLELNSRYFFAYGSSGTHNEFIRQLFINGFVGLFLYLFSILLFFRRIIRHGITHMYLGLGFLSFFLIYSMSLTPLIYINVVYMFIAVVAFFNLPYNNNNELYYFQQKQKT